MIIPEEETSLSMHAFFQSDNSDYFLPSRTATDQMTEAITPALIFDCVIVAEPNTRKS